MNKGRRLVLYAIFFISFTVFTSFSFGFLVGSMIESVQTVDCIVGYAGCVNELSSCVGILNRTAYELNKTSDNVTLGELRHPII